MRTINLIVVHCSATDPLQDIGVAEIKVMHMKRGFHREGYHAIIRRNGQVENGRPIEMVGAHVKGMNARSIGICLVGGVDRHNDPEANFTFEQYEALDRLLSVLMVEFPDGKVEGHKDLPNVYKACPCFNVKEFNTSREKS